MACYGLLPLIANPLVYLGGGCLAYPKLDSAKNRLKKMSETSKQIYIYPSISPM